MRGYINKHPSLGLVLVFLPSFSRGNQEGPGAAGIALVK